MTKKATRGYSGPFRQHMSPFCSLLLKRFWKISLRVYKVIWEEGIQARDSDLFRLFTLYSQLFSPPNPQVTYEIWESNENKGAIEKDSPANLQTKYFLLFQVTTMLTFFTWLYRQYLFLKQYQISTKNIYWEPG